MKYISIILTGAPLSLSASSHDMSFEKKIVSFKSGTLALRGVVYRPKAHGQFPAIVFNHGSSMETHEASDALGPVFAKRGWVFFMPSRRGQGLSRKSGRFIGDEIESARKNGGTSVAAETMVKLLKTVHLDDQVAALAWLRKQPFVSSDQIAVAGVSFGGIQTVLGVQKGQYCAGIDASGGAQSWAIAPTLRTLMLRAVESAKAPIFFFQAENDFDLSPTHILSAAMEKSGRPFQVKIYPPFGKTVKDGHSFGYFGSEIWSDDVFTFLDKHCRLIEDRNSDF